MINSKLYLRNYKNKNGESPILLLINKKGIVRNKSLNIYVKQINWDNKKQRVKAGDPDHVRKNRLLSHFKAKAIKIIDDHVVRDKLLSLNEFMKLFKDENYGSQDFFAYADRLIEQKIGINKENTIRSMRSSMRKLQAFRKELTFGEINFEFIQSYERFLKVERNNNDNSISKSMRLFKVVVNDALHNGLIENNPFGNYKIRRIEGDREHLTEKEVKKLQNIYINKELKSNMHNVLHYFLFSCYTGLSFVDLKELQKKDIVQTEKEKKIISIKRSKTGTQVLVPLNTNAEALLPDIKRMYDKQKLFNILTSQHTNRHLKKIMDIAGIKKRISFHCGRHTFATLCKNYGMNYEVIAKYLGHMDKRTTLGHCCQWRQFSTNV